jgi:hypothetical protein
MFGGSVERLFSILFVVASLLEGIRKKFFESGYHPCIFFFDEFIS